MKSLISKHTRWHSFILAYRFYITSVKLFHHQPVGERSFCGVEFYHNEELIGIEEFANSSIAYRVFANRFGVDSVECVGFTPTRVPSTYRKEVAEKWGWTK